MNSLELNYFFNNIDPCMLLHWAFYEFILLPKKKERKKRWQISDGRRPLRWVGQFPYPHGHEHLPFVVSSSTMLPPPCLPRRDSTYTSSVNLIHGRQALQGQEVLASLFPRRLGRRPSGPTFFFFFFLNVPSHPFTSSPSRMQFLCMFSSYLYCLFISFACKLA